MANQIRMTPDMMRERANQYRAEADNVNGVINKMDTLLAQLQSEWEGAASESYAARYQELKPGFMKAEELIREIAAALDSTAKIVEETDQSIAVSSEHNFVHISTQKHIEKGMGQNGKSNQNDS